MNRPNIKSPSIDFVMKNLPSEQVAMINRKSELSNYMEDVKRGGIKKALQEFAELNNVSFKAIEGDWYDLK